MEDEFFSFGGHNKAVKGAYIEIYSIFGLFCQSTIVATCFQMAKVIESLGDCGFSQSAQTVLLLIKRNILILDKLSYTHITGIVRLQRGYF